MYRQVTILGLQSDPETQAEAFHVAYSDIHEAWKEFLREHNRGRGFVLVGHSQGTRMLRNLLRTEIDHRPRLRKRMVSAFLLGGNVTVKKDQLVNGDFANSPGCSRRGQTGCVVAFSTFNETPPDNSRYGRVGGGNARNPFDFPQGPKYEVLCTNPTSLARNRDRPLQTLVRTEPHPGIIGLLLLQTYGGMPPTRILRGSSPRITTPGNALKTTARTSSSSHPSKMPGSSTRRPSRGGGFTSPT